MATKPTHRSVKDSAWCWGLAAASVLWRRVLGVLLVGSLGLTACRGANRAPESTAPAPTEAPPTIAPATPTPAKPSPETVAPTSTANPQALPTPSPPPVAQVPPTAAAPQGAPLPETLVKQWDPLSNVLMAFGPMTVTPSEVKWGSGQSSPYILVSTEGGFLLKLESVPKFYDTPNPYIKLIPKTNQAGLPTSLEVAFFESEAKVQQNEYIMYGSYFAN